MLVDDDERTERPLVEQGDGLEQAFDAPSATDDDLPEGHPSRKNGVKDKEEGATSDDAAEENDEAATEEVQSLEDRLGSFYKGNADADRENGEGKFTFRGASKNARRNRLISGGVVGVLALMIGFFAAFGNFFAIFKFDHLMENINVKSFSRFNASFSNRSDAYLKAYLKLRIAEITDKNGNYSGDNLFFKANKVDTDNPIRDWYRTLRTGSFEKDLWDKEGISITSVAIKDENGAVKLGAAKITRKGDADIPFDVLNRNDFDTIVAAGNGSLDALNKLGKDADYFFDTEIFPDNKTARKAVKKEVKENTHFWNVLKRRQVRKDIQNKTGIKSWRFFETTRDKLTDKKVALQQKILQKVLPNNKMGSFMQCILGSGPCGSGNDPAAPDNQQNASPDATADPDAKAATDDVNGPTETLDADGSPVYLTDEDGNPTYNIKLDLDNSTAGEITDTVSKAATSEVADDAARLAEQEGLDLVESQVAKEAGGSFSPTKIWSWMNKLTKIHNNLVNGKLSKLVKNFRLVQMAGIYATYAIALDQAKTGQLTSEEFGNMMSTLSDASQNEGWIALNNPGSQTTVNAEATDQQATNYDKNEYCKKSKKEQALNKVHFFCNSPGDSNASKLESAYKNSFVYSLMSPIADFVNGIRNNPVTNFFASIADKFSSAVDAVVGKLFDILKPALNALGISGGVEKLITFVMTKIMSFLGAGPMFDGSGPGGLNMIMAGGAATAEASTRDSGGVVSTPTTSAYTRQLAADYLKDQKDSESLFDKYASLDNPSSLFSTALFNFSSSSLTGSLSSLFSSVGSLPSKLGSIITGHGFAATGTDFDIADWAGVDTYDVPQACQVLDPLDQNYVAKAVGVVSDSPYATDAQATLDKVGTLTIEQERDSAGFWKTVYGNIENKEKQEEIAGAIYNCALFDQRVMGGLGYLSGYTSDGGIDSGDSANVQLPTPTTSSGLEGLDGPIIPCEGQHRDVKRDGYGVDWSGITPTGVIGKSASGQDINVYVRDACPGQTNIRTVVIAATIHAGGESGGQVVAHELLFNEQLPQDVRIVAIPIINQDGFTGNSSYGRVNKNGVNLNRNFDYCWVNAKPSEVDTQQDPDLNSYKGTSEASEPETQAVQKFLLGLGRSSALFSYHSDLNYASPSGPHKGVSSVIAKRYQAIGRSTSLLKDIGYSTNTGCGFLDAWYNNATETPALLIEMSDNHDTDYLVEHADVVAQLINEGVIE